MATGKSELPSEAVQTVTANPADGPLAEEVILSI
jgi:hypothetical protein